MINVKELEVENQEIVDLASVLSVLMGHAEQRGNPIFCELLERFMDKINAHLMHESRSVYGDLLTSNDKDVNKVASQFITNTHELKKILKGYTKRWCVAISSSEDHSGFVDETSEIFKLLNERINLEKAHLFPLLASAEA
jgi:hemerythrin-like domain-containing protein